MKSFTLLLGILINLIFVRHAFNKPQFNSTVQGLREKNFKNTVLTRRVRSLIFPDKTFALLTAAFTKAVLGGIPRGLAYSIEFDFYSPLPDTIEAWKPTLLINKIHRDNAKQMVTSTLSPIYVSNTSREETMPDIDYLSNYYDDNEHASWSSPYFDEYFQYPLDGYSSGENLDAHTGERKDIDWNANAYVDSTLQKKMLYSRQHIKHPNNQNNKIFYKSMHPTKSGRFTNAKSSALKNKFKQYVDNSKWFSYEKKDEASPIRRTVPKWKYNQGYRERRQIYDQLEATGKRFSINVKACVKRAQCEITTYLKPYGESLMEDIVRIILTLPRIHDPNQDYNYTPKTYHNIHCGKYFASSCPYRVLEYLSQNLRNLNRHTL